MDRTTGCVPGGRGQGLSMDPGSRSKWDACTRRGRGAATGIHHHSMEPRPVVRRNHRACGPDMVDIRGSSEEIGMGSCAKPVPHGHIAIGLAAKAATVRSIVRSCSLHGSAPDPLCAPRADGADPGVCTLRSSADGR